jgi:hydrogenase/urease accessory protein HupE
VPEQTNKSSGKQSVKQSVSRLYLHHQHTRSFIGHAAGIVAGFFHVLGMFDFLAKPYWAAMWTLWVFGVIAASLKATTHVPVPCVSYVNCLPWRYVVGLFLFVDCVW